MKIRKRSGECHKQLLFAAAKEKKKLSLFSSFLISKYKS